ncbi:hypothetical protein ACFL3U_03875 [Pseudomonadota bacterium]
MELLFSKFTAAVQRHNLSKHFSQLGRVSVAAVGILGSLAASLLGLLATSAEVSGTNKDPEIVPSGGILNYRTGKLDDGTDPIGWYEKD